MKELTTIHKIAAAIVGGLMLYGLIATLVGGSGGKSVNIPKTSCATDIRNEIKYDEEKQGFFPRAFKIPIAHCGPADEEGTEMWATAQLVWNNGKIDWWSCRDLAHCEAMS